MVVGIEGTHNAGKTTLAHALTAHYRERGVLVDCAPEPARTSPFIEETVIHGKGGFDLSAEVDLFGAQLSATLRAARHNDLLICDKTPMNVLGYARLVLDTPTGSQEAAVLEAMAGFCNAWAPLVYDAVFFLPDAFTDTTDPLRARVSHLQRQAVNSVRSACTESGVPLHDVPGGLSLPARVIHLAKRVDVLRAASRTTLDGHDRRTDPPG